MISIFIMKINVMFWWVCVLSLLVTGVTCFTGCEVDSADYAIYISPDSGTLYKNNSITLTAQGGYVYSWSLSEESWGALNTRAGSQVIYTSLYEPTDDIPAVQVVTLTSTFSNSGESSSTTNSSSTNSHTAEAYITHMPSL